MAKDINKIMSQTVLTTEQLAAIGSIAVESAYLEDIVETLIYKLSGLTRKKGEIFLEKFMLDSKLNLLKELGMIKLKSKKRKLVLSELIGEIKQANSDRTLAIHGFWIPGKITLASIAKGELEQDAKAVRSNSRRQGSLSAHKLADIAKRVSDGRYELFVFFQKFLSPK